MRFFLAKQKSRLVLFACHLLRLPCCLRNHNKKDREFSRIEDEADACRHSTVQLYVDKTRLHQSFKSTCRIISLASSRLSVSSRGNLRSRSLPNVRSAVIGFFTCTQRPHTRITHYSKKSRARLGGFCICWKIILGAVNKQHQQGVSRGISGFRATNTLPTLPGFLDGSVRISLAFSRGGWMKERSLSRQSTIEPASHLMERFREDPSELLHLNHRGPVLFLV